MTQPFKSLYNGYDALTLSGALSYFGKYQSYLPFVLWRMGDKPPQHLLVREHATVKLVPVAAVPHGVYDILRDLLIPKDPPGKSLKVKINKHLSDVKNNVHLYSLCTSGQSTANLKLAVFPRVPL